MPQTNDEWYQAGPQEFYRYFDPYPAQREAEGELTAAQANIEMLTPYLRRLHRRWYAVRADLIEYLRR